MAGYVHITTEAGLSMSSISFNAVIEYPRKYFNSSSKEIELAIYESVDKGEMDFISLIEQDSDGFMVFYKVLTSAYKECESVGICGSLDAQFYGMVMKTWAELLGLMEQDERFIRLY